MSDKNDDNNFNESFWAFVHLIISDEKYLSIEGRILKKIVEANGCYESISKIARKFEMEKKDAHCLCHALENSGCVTLYKNGNKCNIKFSKEVVVEALKIPQKILAEE